MPYDKRREKEVGHSEGFLLAWTGVRIAEGLSIDMHEHETRLALSEAWVDAGFGSNERFEIGEILKPAKGLRIEHWEQSIKPIQYSLEKE